MGKRALLVIKEVGSTAMAGVCDFCGRQFTASPAPKATTVAAHENIEQQFNGHVCYKPQIW
jgi:hypothetical protein